jgi:hypothetical protein
VSSCDLKKNLDSCNCSYEGCPRKGKCCECLTYHRRNGQLPACYFPTDVEKTYDRSAAAFVRTFQARGKCW